MRRIQKITALVLSLSLVWTLLFTGHEHSVWAGDVENLEARLSAIEEQKAQAEQELAQLRANEQEGREELARLRNDQKLEQAAYDALAVKLQTAAKHLESAIQAHQQSLAHLAEQQRQYESRVVSLFRIRHKSNLEMLLGSDSIASFFTNMELMDYVSSSDKRILENLKEAEQQAEQSRQRADQTKQEYEQFVAEKQQLLEKIANNVGSQEELVKSLNSQILTRSDDIYNLAQDQAQTSAELENAKAERERLAEEARQERARREAEAARQREAQQDLGSSGGGGGGYDASYGESGYMLWPLANSREISSYFGWRTNPFDGSRTTFHWGLDFPASPGTPVRATRAGKVIVANAPIQGSTYGWGNSAFGNYIALVHDDGMITMYCHLKNVYVSVGQYVNQGEVIGGVGSTGSSTGPHLHYQVSVGDQDGVDPLPYLNS